MRCCHVCFINILLQNPYHGRVIEIENTFWGDGMKYISKGMVIRNSTEDLLFVSHCGVDFELTGIEAALWLNGRFGFAAADSDILSEMALRQLKRKELIALTDGPGKVGEYRALTQCALVPTVKNKGLLNAAEKEMLLWLTGAGLRLSMAELVCLQEHSIAPSPALLGVEHRQALTEQLYTKDNIMDNLLELQMEDALKRDEVVATALALLKKKRLILL